jgi:hypothetical protein
MRFLGRQIGLHDTDAHLPRKVVQPIYGALGFDASGTIFRSSSIALPTAWPSDTSRRVQSRFPSFRVDVQRQPPASKALAQSRPC